MARLVNKIPPIHPGILLREDMDALGLSARAVYFGTRRHADVSMNLQKTYDLKKAELNMVPPYAPRSSGGWHRLFRITGVYATQTFGGQESYYSVPKYRPPIANDLGRDHTFACRFPLQGRSIPQGMRLNNNARAQAGESIRPSFQQ